MIASARTNGRKAWKLYLIPGLLVGGIKFASVFTWFFYHSIGAAIGLTHSNYGAGDVVGILLMGFIGIALAIIGWPIVIFGVLTGRAYLPVVLFYPWMSPH